MLSTSILADDLGIEAKYKAKVSRMPSRQSQGLDHTRHLLEN